VERADEINVTLSDGRTLKAEMVGTDPRVDLAVLKVQPDALVEIGFANSAQARVGDFVVAIGNPFGLNQTVTSGIISALGRSGLGIEGYEDFIQTDASINPGNSGGALVDLGGRLIGINTAILAPAGGNVGIGFAIPANMVRAIMGELIAHGEVRRGFLGLTVQGLNPDLAEAFGVENRDGVVVVEIQPDGAAARAGLRPGDIIVRVDDQPIRRVTEFDGQAALMFVGERVAIEVLRDGQPRTLTLEIVDEPLEKVPGERLDRRLLGTTLQNFRNEADAADSAGVLVSEVGEDTLAWQFGLRPGDIVVACNRRGVRNLDDLQASVERSGDQLLLRVYRAGQYGYIVIR
ncbi:MAG: trypsin-like peptidase domain-containing protein, partial [Gammaproteobacteria bacterium]